MGGELLLVLGDLVLLGGSSSLLEGSEVSSVLQSLRGDEPLDSGGLGVGLARLGGNLPSGIQSAKNSLETTRLGSRNSTHRTVYFLTSSLEDKLKNRLILVARFGPSRMGKTRSVSPEMSFSPCALIFRAKTVISVPDQPCSFIFPRC